MISRYYTKEVLAFYEANLRFDIMCKAKGYKQKLFRVLLQLSDCFLLRMDWRPNVALLILFLVPTILALIASSVLKCIALIICKKK